MTNPTPIPSTPPIPIAAGVKANVSVLVISTDIAAQTAVIRVVDNNGAFLTPAVTLPYGVITAVEFPVVVGDVLESTDGKQTTGVVRWTDGLSWSESPNGQSTARPTTGWRRLGNFPIA
jgi:hypothetical protein